MKLTQEQKTPEMFECLLALNDKCFEPNERASCDKFKAHFAQDDIFVDHLLLPTAFALVTDRSGPYLMIIAVASEVRHLGLGTMLLKEIEEYYRPHWATIQLTCKVDNWAAQRLYLKHGYRIARVIPRYYGAEDGVLMRRVL